ncbi:MAG TPA: hypothetical protein PK299_13360 [Anaerolineales bacterium]|nr:hypothetical protein [Anaerolineales bacterium]
MNNRIMAFVCLGIFAAVLAIVIGQRLSSESMAVLLGVMAGIVASIPTSLLVVWFALKVHPPSPTLPVQSQAPQAQASQSRPEERIVVVAPQPMPVWSNPQMASPMQGWSRPLNQTPNRQFSAIGGAQLEDSQPLPHSEQSWLS